MRPKNGTQAVADGRVENGEWKEEVLLKGLLCAGAILICCTGAQSASAQQIGRYQIIASPVSTAQDGGPAIIMLDTTTGQSWRLTRDGRSSPYSKWTSLSFQTYDAGFQETLVPLPPPPH